jgi:hypothetical protein
MKIKTFSASAHTFKALQAFAVIVQSGTRFETLKALHALKASPLFKGKKGWQANFAKLEKSLHRCNPSTVFSP